MESQVEEVKRKTDIVEVIGSYVRLNRAGQTYKGLCPFHGERTPSFMVSPDRGTWRCFGCGEHGDVISFLEKHDNLTFIEALEQLAKRAGVELERDEKFAAKGRSKQRLYDILNLSAEYYTYLLVEHDLGKEAREYLAKRQVDSELIKQYRLGFAPDSWQSLQQYLTKKGFGLEEIRQSGMSSQNDGGREYDRFRNRVMFAVTDGMGRVVGFSGRSMEAEPKGAKYLNSPDGPLFHKGQLLYGLSVAKDSIRKKDRIVLVEGNVDVLSSARVGVGEVVAPLGTALTEDQVKVMKRFSGRVYVAFDGDKAGQAATRKAIDLLRQAELDIKIVRLPHGGDPDECISIDANSWVKAVDEATEVVDFYLSWAGSQHDLRTEKGKQAAAEEILPLFILNNNNQQAQAMLFPKIANALQLDEAVLRRQAREMLRREAQGRQATSDERRGLGGGKTQERATGDERRVVKKLSRQEVLVEYLVGCWLNLPLEEVQADRFGEMLALLPVDAAEHEAELVAAFREMVAEKGRLSVKRWADSLSEEGQAELDRLSSVVIESSLTDSGTIGVVNNSSITVDQRLTELLDVVREIKRLSLKKQLDTLSRSLKQAEVLDKHKVLELQQQFIEISGQLSAMGRK